MGQVIFHSTNELMPHQFVQNKFIQEFVTVSLLIKYYASKSSQFTNGLAKG